MMKYWWQMWLVAVGVILLIIVAMASLEFLVFILGGFVILLFLSGLISLIEGNRPRHW